MSHVVFHRDSGQMVRVFRARFAAERMAQKLNLGQGYVAYVVKDDLGYRDTVRKIGRLMGESQ